MFKLIFTCVLDTFLYPGNFDNRLWLSDKTQVNVRVSPYGWFVNCVTFWCGGFKLAATVLKTLISRGFYTCEARCRNISESNAAHLV